jgi:hypothetical protein
MRSSHVRFSFFFSFLTPIIAHDREFSGFHGHLCLLSGVKEAQKKGKLSFFASDA